MKQVCLLFCLALFAGIVKAETLLWKVDGTIIHPSCFYLKWSSDDNYEELVEGTNCTAEEIGQCLGRENGIDIYKVVYGGTLAINIADCPIETSPIGEADEEVSGKFNPKYGYMSNRESRGYTWYGVAQTLPLGLCKRLAPHVSYKCRDIRLVEIYYSNGGTATWKYGNIYGLFSDTDSGHEVMVPLVNTRSVKDAMAYIKVLQE